MRVLIIDDDQCILCLLKRAFEKWGHKVETYENAGHCPAYWCKSCPCDLFEKGCPDLILIDVNMPFVNGLSFVESLKRNGCKCPKIGLMSGDWGEADRQKAIEMGAMIFDKPFDLNKLSAWASHVNERAA